MKKLAVFRLIHEANSFSVAPCDLQTFKGYEWSKGLPAIDRHMRSNSEIGGAIDFVASHGWSATYLRFAGCSPCGDLVPELFEQIVAELIEDLGRNSWDAVYLNLHGACTVGGGRSAESELIRRVRAALPDVPVGVSFDLHGNLDPAIADLVTIAIGYKTHPHIDHRETATAVLEVLDSVVVGKLRPQVAMVKLPLLLPSANMRTTDGPMRDMIAYANELKAKHGALDISILGGFPYGDTVYAGATVIASTNGDKALAERLADDMAATLWAARDRFFIQQPNAAQGLALALKETGRPIAIADNADNPGSGGIADTPNLLRTLLDAELQEKSVFAFLHDTDLVERCHREGVGARFTAQLGAKKTKAYGESIVREIAVVKLVVDCRFRNSGPMNHGVEIFFGKTAVVRVGNLSIILTSACKSPSDPEFYRIHDISFPDYKLLGAKAKNHFRAAFVHVFERIVDVDEAGPAVLDFTHLPFAHLPPNLYPFVPAAQTSCGAATPVM